MLRCRCDVFDELTEEVHFHPQVVIKSPRSEGGDVVGPLLTLHDVENAGAPKCHLQGAP